MAHYCVNQFSQAVNKVIKNVWKREASNEMSCVVNPF